MSCYIITFEVKPSTKDYTTLYAAIKAYGTWAHIAENIWAVVTDQTSVQIRDNLMSHMQSTDRLFVVKSGVEAAWANVMCNIEWLKKNL